MKTEGNNLMRTEKFEDALLMYSKVNFASIAVYIIHLVRLSFYWYVSFCLLKTKGNNLMWKDLRTYIPCTM